MITRIATFPQKTVKSIGLDTLQRNSFFVHLANALLSMLSDTSSDVRKAAVYRIQCLRAIMEPVNQSKINMQKSEDKNDSSDTIPTPTIRKFLLPQVNLQARSYHKMTNVNTTNMTEPPLLRLFPDQKIEEITTTPLKLHHPCHNQAVKRHIKNVGEASLSVCGFEKRDGVVLEKLRSRKLTKCYDTKKNSNVNNKIISSVVFMS